MRRNASSLPVVGITLLALALPVAADVPFYAETLDDQPSSDGGGVGRYSDVAVDGSGRLHIAYHWQDPDFLGNQELRYARWNGHLWELEVIAKGGGAFATPARDVRIVVDSWDRPHVAHYDEADGGLYYSWKSQGGWTTELIEAGPMTSGFDFGLSPNDVPQVVYRDGGGFFRWGVRSGGVWTSEGLLGPGHGPGIHVVSNVEVFAVSGDGASQVRLSRRLPGFTVTWQIEAVPTGRAAVAIAANGTIHVVYYDTLAGAAKHATAEHGAVTDWNIETVATGDFGEDWSLIAVDDSGVIHAVWGLLYGRRGTDGTWELEPFGGTFASFGLVGLDTDRRGHAHITYAEHAVVHISSGLRLLSPRGGQALVPGRPTPVRWLAGGAADVSFSLDGGTSWSTAASGAGNETMITLPLAETSDLRVRVERATFPASDESVAPIALGEALETTFAATTIPLSGDYLHTSLALDADGATNVAALDDDTYVLGYAVQSEDGWIAETVPGTIEPTGTPSLAMAGIGEARIAYYDAADNEVKYASRTSGGVWSIEAVGATSSTPREVALALDASGSAHVVYAYDPPATIHQYATNRTGSWVLSTIAGVGTGGQYADVAIRDEIIYVSARNGNDESLVLATKPVASGGWSVETVDDWRRNFGDESSIAVDALGGVHISYQDADSADVRYAHRPAGETSWRIQVVAEDVGSTSHTNLAVDGSEHVLIGYVSEANEVMVSRRHPGGAWTHEKLADAFSSTVVDVALTPEGAARVTYANFGVGYATSGIELVGPTPGDTWPVGAMRTITWLGAGAVDLQLSVNGGASWQTLVEDVSGGAHDVLVPHQPTSFALVRAVRDVPAAQTVSSGLFTIESVIALLRFDADVASSGRGVSLRWNTDPGPEDLLGYRLDRARAGAEWTELAGGLTEPTYEDPTGRAGDRYRLTAYNGLGEPLVLGETRVGAIAPLAAGPLPFRGAAPLRIAFTTGSAPGATTSATRVELFDVRGRRVATLVDEVLPAGRHEVVWDGRDEAGVNVSSGTYFLRRVSAGDVRTMKVPVLR